MANRWWPGVPDDRRRTFILACPHAYRDLNSTIFKQKAQLTGQRQKTRRVAIEEQKDPGGCDRCGLARCLSARRLGRQGHFRAGHCPGQVRRASAEWARVL